MNKRYTVFIPLIDQSENSANHELLEVYSDICRIGEDAAAGLSAEEKEAAYKRGLGPIAARFLRITLHNSAQTAVEAVRKIHIPKPYCAFYQWLKPQAWLERQRLCPSSVSAAEGDSAELGLAAVLLASAGGSKERQFIATGKLRTQGPKPHDVEVLPVSGTAEKLQFILQQRLARRLPAKSLLCFIPQRYIYYDAAGKAQEGNVLDLPEIALLKAQNIDAVPLGWLSEAMSHLGVRSARMTAADWFICTFAALLLLGGIVVGMYRYWLWRDIPVQFVAPLADIRAAPFELCDGDNYSYPLPLQDAGQTRKAHLIPTQSKMEWYVGIDPNFAAILDTRKFFVINLILGEKTGLKFRDSKTFPHGMFELGDIYGAAVETPEEEEDRVLVVLVRREPFEESDKMAFADEFKRFYNATTQKYDPQMAADYFETKAPGKLKFKFATANTLKKCEQ